MGKNSFSLASLDSSHNSPQKNTSSFFGDPEREPRGNSKFFAHPQRGSQGKTAISLPPSPREVAARRADGRSASVSLKYDGKNIEFAKQLRKDATPQERRLWYCFLAQYPVRFQRQKPIGAFIADFYCHEAKLVIELDGSQHFSEEGIKRDRFRTEKLEGYDLTVIRFTNREIDENFLGVCEYIDFVVKSGMR